MNINVVLPFCQFPNQRPVVYEWVMEYVEKCGMNLSEYGVLSRIVSKVQRYDAATDTWDNGGYCSLAIQSICNTFSADRANVQRCINVLELAGIISVQRRYGIPHTITLTPHTEWVEVNFRELRAIANKGKRAPILSRSPDAVDAHAVTDTITDTNAHAVDAMDAVDTFTRSPDAVDNVTVTDAVDVATNAHAVDAVDADAVDTATNAVTVTDADAVDTVTDAVDISTNTDAHVTNAVDTVTPSPNGKQAPIIKPKLNTATDTNGYRHNPYAINTPLPVIGSPPPGDVKAKYCDGNGKRVMPSPDAHDTDTLPMSTLPVMDSNGHAVGTVTISGDKSKSKSKSKSKRSYPPSPNQYADDDDDDAFPIFGMNYSEYRASELWNRK